MEVPNKPAQSSLLLVDEDKKVKKLIKAIFSNLNYLKEKWFTIITEMQSVDSLIADLHQKIKKRQ